MLTEQIIDSTQAQRDDDSEHLEPYSVLNGRCVGVRYYNGIATMGEHVLFRREPTNAYDRNAIRIDNVDGVQIGHVPRPLAAKLAPLLDRRIAGLEGTVAGRKGPFDLPIRYEILCPSREPDRSAAITAIKAARIPGAVLSEEHKRIEKEMRDREKAAGKAEKARRKRKKGGAAGPGGKGAIEEPIGPDAEFMGSQTLSQVEVKQNWENLTSGAQQMINPREVSELVQKFGASEEELQKMEMAMQPARLKTQLLPYQLQVSPSRDVQVRCCDHELTTLTQNRALPGSFDRSTPSFQPATKSFSCGSSPPPTNTRTLPLILPSLNPLWLQLVCLQMTWVWERPYRPLH